MEQFLQQLGGGHSFSNTMLIWALIMSRLPGTLILMLLAPFLLDGRQYVVVGAGDSLYAFTLQQ